MNVKQEVRHFAVAGLSEHFVVSLQGIMQGSFLSGFIGFGQVISGEKSF